MSSRRVPSHYAARSVQTPGMLRHGGPSELTREHLVLESRTLPVHLEDKIADQAEEIERLSAENRRLAGIHVSLREELVATQHEMPRVNARISSMRAESDIQIRVLLDKIAKREADIRAGESIKKDLQKLHLEAQSLVRVRQELIAKIQQTSQELQKVRIDAKSLPDLHAELDGLRQEHQKLRAAFQYEKASNIAKVEQLHMMEKDLYGMSRELEKLQVEVQNAEMRAHASNPYHNSYMNPNPPYPTPIPSSGVFADGYGKPVVHPGFAPAGEGMFKYSHANREASAAVGVSSVPVPGPSSGAVWSGSFDPPLASR